MRQLKFVLLVVVATGWLSILTPLPFAWGIRGKLDQPSISIPIVGEGAARAPDPICSAMQEVLSQHAKQFVSGRFINAHSTMEFTGTATELNALLSDFAAIDGAKMLVRFSNGSDNLLQLDVKEKLASMPHQWSVEHHGWGDAQYLSITILLGDGKIKPEEVQIPLIVGNRSATTSGAELPVNANSERQP